MLGGKLDRPPVAGGKELPFPAPAAVPNRADGVDHVADRQPAGAGDLRIAGRAAAKLATFLKQLGPGGPMDRAVYTAAAKEGCVCGVDDRIGLPLRCDVPLVERDPARHRQQGSGTVGAW